MFDEHRGLRIKFILGSTLFLLVAMSFLGGISYYYANKYLMISEDESIDFMTQKYSTIVSGEIDKIIGVIESVADTARIKEAKDKNLVTQALNDGIKRAPQLSSMAYIALDGKTFYQDGRIDNLSDRDYFKRIIETKENYISPVILSDTTKKLSVMFVVPVFQMNQLKGAVVGAYPLENIDKVLQKVRIKQSGYGYMLDSKGSVIAHGVNLDLPGKLNVLESDKIDSRLGDLYQKVLQVNDRQTGKYIPDGSNDEYLISLSPLSIAGGNKWVLGLTAPEHEVMALSYNLKLAIFVITIVFLVLIALLVFAIIGRFTKPIMMINEQLKQIAVGNLNLPTLLVERRDEIGDLASSCNKMVIDIKALVMNISDLTEQVAAAAEELTAGSQQSAEVTGHIAQAVTDVASSATLQLQSVHNATVALNKMSNSIKEVADKMNWAADKSSESADSAQLGRQQIDKAVKQIEAIDITVNNLANTVLSLGKRSQEIGEIVNTISGIAEQTNLLALNAAIEAVRAGEHGQSFVVVAEEVRKLAEQSQQATQQIAELISIVQNDTNKAVFAMEEGTREVEIGTRVVNEAGESFVAIVDKIQNVSKEIHEVLVRTKELSQGADIIVRSVEIVNDNSKIIAEESESVSAATEEQAAAMTEISISSNRLAELAQNLQKEVTHFKI